MGRPYVVYLPSDNVYACRHCRSHLAAKEGGNLLSKAFHSRSGRAYLFQNIVNVACGEPEERLMTTGLHVVCDIYCSTCQILNPETAQPLGWRYDLAREASQRYKEGKYILERAAVVDVDRKRSAAAQLPLAASGSGSGSGSGFGSVLDSMTGSAAGAECECCDYSEDEETGC